MKPWPRPWLHSYCETLDENLYHVLMKGVIEVNTTLITLRPILLDTAPPPSGQPTKKLLFINLLLASALKS